MVVKPVMRGNGRAVTLFIFLFYDDDHLPGLQSFHSFVKTAKITRIICDKIDASPVFIENQSGICFIQKCFEMFESS